MADIITLKDALQRLKDTGHHSDLSSLLKKAVMLKNSLPEFKKGINVFNFKKIKVLFEAKIAEILIKRQLIGSDFFLCGTYIADLLTETAKKIPKSWFAIDYIIEGNKKGSPQILKQGANICFLICTVFKGRSEIRAMTYKDYEALGIGLFYQFYDQTGQEIGYYMGRQYATMVGVTDECIKTI